MGNYDTCKKLQKLPRMHLDMARTVGEVVSRRPHLTDRLGFIVVQPLAQHTAQKPAI
jgi:hypothetical protein